MPYEGNHTLSVAVSHNAQETGTVSPPPLRRWVVMSLSRLRFAYSAVATLLVALLLGLAGLSFATFAVTRALLRDGFASTR